VKMESFSPFCLSCFLNVLRMKRMTSAAPDGPSLN
jgi:hypothetical protein